MLNTIGYEGARPEDFLQTLQLAGVGLVIDVRDRAQSRRPGFSKTALQQSLAGSGISYVHFRELGDPKEGREAARAKDMVKFRQIFSEVMRSSQAIAAIAKVAEAASKEAVCLLCYERDPVHCHRTLISDRIEMMIGQKARHLGVRRFEQAEQHTGRMRHPRESVAA